VAKISWTDEAQRWLKDIYDYIAADDPSAAARVVEGIHERARVLLRFPEIGHRYASARAENVRILLYGHYRIAYVLKPDGDIDILGVFHAALDIDRYLL